MENSSTPKPLAFHGTPMGYLVTSIVSGVSAYIPFFGWAFGYNYSANWLAENAEVNGRKVKYSAGYGETLKFVSVNILLVFITFGIYIFWFGPKSYRYMVDHTSYADEAAPALAQPVPAAPALMPTDTIAAAPVASVTPVDTASAPVADESTAPVASAAPMEGQASPSEPVAPAPPTV